jgi:hypothetical protein
MRKTETKEISLPEAKEKLRQSIEMASPARLIEKHPVGSAVIALLTGVSLGYSRTARHVAGTAISGISRMITPAVLGAITKAVLSASGEDRD